MTDKTLSRVREICEVSGVTMKNEIVVFGSTYMKKFPFYEFLSKCRMENAVYNHSIEDLSLIEAQEVLTECVLNAEPSKVFLCLGENEYEKEDSVALYGQIVTRIRTELPRAKIYLIELKEKGAERFNDEIKKMCDGKHVFCIKFATGGDSKLETYKEQFKQMSCFFRDKLMLSDAFAIANL